MNKVVMDSLWLKENSKKLTEPLNKNIIADVVIIGGGIAGISAAYFLSKTNKNVVLLEKNSVGAGSTGYTTAMITQYIDNDLSTLATVFGSKGKRIWDSGGDAINLVEQIVKKENINCEFKRVPYFVYANNKQQKDRLIEEAKAAKKMGINLQFQEDDKLPFKNRGYLTLLNQAKFHPLKYLTALTSVVSKKIDIYDNSEVVRIEGKGPYVVKTKDGEVCANYVLVTTHSPFNNPLPFFFKKGRYTTYVKVLKIPKNTYPEALYQDMNTPYHYFRIDKFKDWDQLMIGGEDHRSDIPVSSKKSFSSLENYIKDTFPEIGLNVTNQWDGHLIESIDGLPYIGPLRGNKNIFYATAFSGNGMTYGTLAGLILSDLCEGDKNKYFDLYDASRFPTISQLLQKGKDYVSVFFGGALRNTFER